jgi:hypothetical protein
MGSSSTGFAIFPLMFGDENRERRWSSSISSSYNGAGNSSFNSCGGRKYGTSKETTRYNIKLGGRRSSGERYSSESRSCRSYCSSWNCSTSRRCSSKLNGRLMRWRDISG